MRRLPYMSPRRPEIGVMIAAASSVEVTTQAVSSRLASSSSGSFDWIGTTSVNMNDEHEAGDGQDRDDRALPRHPGESSSCVLIP